MFGIYYHNGVGAAGQLDLNYRIDIVGQQYILRAGTFYVAGVKYTLPNDVSFSDFGDAIQGSLWSKDPSQPLVMAALPSAYISHAMDPATRDLWYADYGNRVAVIFETVTHVYEVSTKTSIPGNKLLVNRCIPRGVAPADTLPVQPTATVTPAIQDHPAAQIGKARLEAKLASPKASAANKTWDELNAEERDAVMRSIAERTGLVQTPK